MKESGLVAPFNRDDVFGGEDFEFATGRLATALGPEAMEQVSVPKAIFHWSTSAASTDGKLSIEAFTGGGSNSERFGILRAFL